MLQTLNVDRSDPLVYEKQATVMRNVVLSETMIVLQTLGGGGDVAIQGVS